MNPRPLFILLAAATNSWCVCQEAPPGAAYLNVVNLITLREPTHINLGGFQFNGGEPVPPGESSGLVAILPGTHTLTLANPGAKPGSVSGPLTLEDGRTTAVICYDEVREYKDGSRESKLRYNVMVEGEAGRGPRMSLVSLLKEPFVGLEVGGVAVTLEARLAHAFEVKSGDTVPIVHAGRRLAVVEIMKPGHYVGFLFENPETGEVELSMIQNEKLEYQPPLEEDWEEKEKKAE